MSLMRDARVTKSIDPSSLRAPAEHMCSTIPPAPMLCIGAPHHNRNSNLFRSKYLAVRLHNTPDLNTPCANNLWASSLPIQPRPKDLTCLARDVKCCGQRVAQRK